MPENISEIVQNPNLPANHQDAGMIRMPASPSPTVSRVPFKVGMSFSKAVEEILAGKKVAKKEWEEVDCYCFLEGELLSIHRNGRNHQWIISIGDISTDDWVIVG